MNNYKNSKNIVFKELEETFDLIDEKQVQIYTEMIVNAEKVFVVGVGRVLLSLKATAKRLSHLGIDIHIVGDITEPAIGNKDLLIVGSGSGESMFPLGIASKAKEFGAKVVHIGSSKKSSMTKYSDHFVHIPVNNKIELSGVISEQPMTSLFEQSLLLLGDIVAFMIVQEKSIKIEELWQYHANLE